MSNSTISKYIICFLIVLVFSSTAYSKYKLTINTNKPSYEGSEKIEITASNVYGEGVINYSWLSVEEWVGNKWKLIRTDVDCPCQAKCKKLTVSLERGEIKQHIWDKMDNECSRVKSGKFRFVIYGSWSNNLKSNILIGVSDIIEIK